MLLTVSSVGWRLQDSGDEFERTDALRPESHLELNWHQEGAETIVTGVWVSLYFTDTEPVRKLMVYQLDAQDLEWQFTFEGEHAALTVGLEWAGMDEDAGEVTLINHGVPRSLLDEIEDHPAT